MELYGQDAELELLARLIERLGLTSFIDVGAERGALAEGALAAGIERLHAVEPHPDNAAELRRRFASDRRVKVHELAASDADGTATLHLSSDPSGDVIPYGHTLHSPEDTSAIVWRRTLEVSRRSLGSLVADGELPGEVGVLKIDTEGHDLAVLRGMGELTADVVMIEHWSELPLGLGPCPWTTREVVDCLRPRGFAHFAFVAHRGEFVTLKWDDGEIESGAMGNLVFVADRLLDRAYPVLLGYAGDLADSAVGVGQHYMRAAAERLAVLEELRQAAEARLSALARTSEELTRVRGELDALRAEGTPLESR